MAGTVTAMALVTHTVTAVTPAVAGSGAMATGWGRNDWGQAIRGAVLTVDGVPRWAAATDGAFGEVAEEVAATIPRTEWEALVRGAGIHELCVRGTDTAGSTGSTSCVLVAGPRATVVPLHKG